MCVCVCVLFCGEGVGLKIREGGKGVLEHYSCSFQGCGSFRLQGCGGEFEDLGCGAMGDGSGSLKMGGLCSSQTLKAQRAMLPSLVTATPTLM